MKGREPVERMLQLARPVMVATRAVQKTLLLCENKALGKYTEDVVLSKQLETLFRVIPPSLYLALAMTGPEEKAQRWRLMEELRITE